MGRHDVGINSLTHRDDGSRVEVPVSHDDWRQWVSAGGTRNWMLDDPLLDWLQLYGKSCEYVPRKELETYDEDLDFLAFILEKSRGFEAGILKLIEQKYDVTTIAKDFREIASLDKAKETFDAMKQGACIIYQAVLWDAQNRNYGAPDFLVRSDVLQQEFPRIISDEEAAKSAPDLGAIDWHYIVVDTKFTTLHLNAKGTELSNGGSCLPTKRSCISTTGCWDVYRGSNRPSPICWGVAGSRRAKVSLHAALTQWTAWDRFHRTERLPINSR